jgi:hypothetical protein
MQGGSVGVCDNRYISALDFEGKQVMRFLSLLTSPRQALERDWRQRQRELDAAFARGRRRRRDRAMLT